MMTNWRASALAVLALAAPAAANAAGLCQLVSQTGGNNTVTYDPFATMATTANINGVQMMRLRGTGGALVTQITYYLKARASGFDAATLKVVTGSGSGGTGTGYNTNILSPSNGTPMPNNNATPPAGTFRWTFNPADTQSAAPFTLNYQISLPAGLDVAASTQLVFDLVYSCRARDDNGVTYQDTGTVTGALGLNVTVRNALQAYFNGQASASTLSFDFGELGTTDTPNVTGAPASYTKTGNINVRSSGAYSVDLTSDNNYRMTYPGGNPATPDQSLTYSVTLLGQTRSGTSGSGATVLPITRQCQRGGVPAPGAQLPLSVTLTEGGRTKTPAPVYSDRLVITIAPIVSTQVGKCP